MLIIFELQNKYYVNAVYQVEQSDSNSNTLYKATITNNQEGRDLDTGETKTLNNVNGILLWNDDEDEPIEFPDNNFVEANINLTKNIQSFLDIIYRPLLF